MEKLIYFLDDGLIEDLKNLIGQPLRQIEFREIIPSGKVGALPMTVWAGDVPVTIGYGSDEFPISPYDYYPLSYLVQKPNPLEPSRGTNRVIHLKNQTLTEVEIVRAVVKGYFNSRQFLDIAIDLSFVFYTENGFVSLQRTFLDDFAVDIQLGQNDDEVTLVTPDFTGETDLEYRYEASLEVFPLSVR